MHDGVARLLPMSFLSLKTEHAALGVGGSAAGEAAGTTSFLYTMLLGVTYGCMHIIGPDHLGTLMALSAASAPRRAFTVGAAWSLGHCAGMVLIALLLVALQKLAAIDVEAWEHFGDYVIGTSLVLCGMYFVLREDQYLQESEDGSVSLKSCECCHQVPAGYGSTEPVGRMPPRQRLHGRGKLQACSSYHAGSCCSGGSHSHGAGEDCCSSTGAESGADSIEEAKVEVAAPPEVLAKDSGCHNYAASLLGIFQGMCCPMGLVGITFIASLPPTGVLTFLLSFLLVSALGTGIIAACWAMLMRAQACTPISSKAMYRASCYFTVCLGVVWIIANACGFLESLNYAEQHDKPVLPVVEPAVKVG